MEAPPVQYTTTSDGVSIAWAEAGQGPALLYCAGAPFSHVQELYALRGAAFEAATQSFRLVTFDARGTGMSERDVAGVSAETLLLDAQAVIDAAKLDRFIAQAFGGSILALSTCLRLATAFPERVTHVVLESPFQNMREIADTSMGKAGLALAELDWTVYLQTLVRVLAGWDAATSDFVDSLAKVIGGWVDPAVGLRYVREWETVDVGDLLPQVSQPTLVLRNDPFYVPARCCQRVAAKIPGAQFRQYSDPTYVQQAELIRAFVAQSAPPPAQEAPGASPFRTVLFTDIEGSTAITQRLGDAKAREVLREHERITRECLKAHGGSEVKTMGDGFMASFGSVTRAVECAIALQRAMEALTPDPSPAAAGEGQSVGPLKIRCGLNAGEPIEEDGDLFGATVILAARIAAKAEGGEILVADTVRGLCSGQGFLFSDRGDFVAKGFEEPVRVFEVRWREVGEETTSGQNRTPPAVVALRLTSDSGHEVELLNRGARDLWDVLVENHEPRPEGTDQFRKAIVPFLKAGEAKSVFLKDDVHDYRLSGSGYGLRITWSEGGSASHSAQFRAHERKRGADLVWEPSG